MTERPERKVWEPLTMLEDPADDQGFRTSHLLKGKKGARKKDVFPLASPVEMLLPVR